MSIMASEVTKVIVRMMCICTYFHEVEMFMCAVSSHCPVSFSFVGHTAPHVHNTPVARQLQCHINHCVVIMFLNARQICSRGVLKTWDIKNRQWQRQTALLGAAVHILLDAVQILSIDRLKTALKFCTNTKNYLKRTAAPLSLFIASNSV